MASGAALPSPDPSPLPAQAWRQLSRAMIGPLLHPGHAQSRRYAGQRRTAIQPRTHKRSPAAQSQLTLPRRSPLLGATGWRPPSEERVIASPTTRARQAC